jgi:hypothetical protein
MTPLLFTRCVRDEVDTESPFQTSVDDDAIVSTETQVAGSGAHAVRAGAEPFAEEGTPRAAVNEPEENQCLPHGAKRDRMTREGQTYWDSPLDGGWGWGHDGGEGVSVGWRRIGVRPGWRNWQTLGT